MRVSRSDPEFKDARRLPAEWVLSIRAELSDVPEYIRLRRLLKVMIRSFGIRVVSIEEVKR